MKRGIIMIRKYLLSNKLLSSLVILFTILQSIFTAGLALFFGRFIDTATNIGNGSSDAKSLVILSSLLLLYIFVLSLFDYLRRFFRAGFFTQTDETIKLEYFDQLLNLDIKEYTKRDTGHYLSRFSNDLPIVIKDYVMEFFNLLLYFFQAIFAILVAFYISWVLALAFIGLAIVIVLFTSSFEQKFSDIRQKLSSSNIKYIMELKSSLGGFEDIRLNKAELVFKKSLQKEILNVNHFRGKWWNLEAIYSPGAALLTRLLTFSAIVISTILFMNGIFSIGLLTSSIYISVTIFNPISDFFEQITFMKSNKNLANTIFNELNVKTIKNKQLLGEIESYEIKDISLKYDDKQDYIFNNFSLEIKKGKKYLLIGSSGTGKSTLLKIMLGLKNYEGSVLINNEELSSYNLNDIYSKIAYVAQDSYIFNKTIRENIDLADIYNDYEVSNVLKKVKLGHLDKENRLERFITKDVLQVSGGEKQRICLARALIKNPEMLLLDEVTASLDSTTAFEVEKTITSFDTTTVYSCHKATKDLIELFDFVISMKGEVPILIEVNEYVKSIN